MLLYCTWCRCHAIELYALLCKVDYRQLLALGPSWLQASCWLWPSRAFRPCDPHIIINTEGGYPELEGREGLFGGILYGKVQTIFSHNSALHRGLSAWHLPPNTPPNTPDTHLAPHNTTKTAGSYFEQVTENTIYRKHCYLITSSWPVSRWRNQQTVLLTLPSVPCMIHHQYRVCSAVKLFLFLRQN